MNPDLKAKWISALRSGRYTQGQKRLKTKEGHYCCLGVLCKVLEKPEYIQLGTRGDNYCDLRAASGLTHTQTDLLTRLNDTLRESFTQIADYIEANL